MRRILVALVVAVSLLSWTTGQAFAFDCFVANKPAGAGSVATVNLDTGQEIPNKPNPGDQEKPHGGFVTLTGTIPGTDTSINADIFVHPPLQAQAPFVEPGVVPGATKQEQKGGGCDGKGWDTLEACYFAGG
ncbi:MAG: hypothetical protein ACYC4L_13345 [Chloroflexota bacterium]